MTVRNGEIVSAADLGGVAVSDDVRHNLKTLDALLSFAIDAQCTSEQVRITGSDAGVPTRIYVDPKRSVADDEFDVSISAFEALAP